MLYTTHLASFTPHILEADFASHHFSCKPTSFTPLILRVSHHTFWKPILLHTTHPASLHASHHSSCEIHTTHSGSRFGCTPLVLQVYMLHTTHPASLHASHHASRELHTTHPASLQAAHDTSREIHTIRPTSLHPPHHTSWEPIWLHTTRLASRLCPTPPRL